MSAPKPEPESPLRPAFSEEDYLAIAPNHLTRKKSDISHGESDYDPYRTTYTTKPVSNATKKAAKRKVSNPVKTPEEDEENWIHRDKLAAIESRELEAAGFPVGRMSRPNSRTAESSSDRKASGNREPSLDIYPEDEEEDPYAKFPDAYPPREEKRQRIVPPISAEEDDREKKAIDYELRTPEEVAAAETEQNGQYFRLQPPARPNGSRLPIPRSSPVPVPAKIVERDSPLTRSRTSSGTNGPPELVRPRSRSVGSQNLLEDEPPLTPTNARGSMNSDHSPPKARIPNGAPTSAARRSSKTRVASTTSTKARTSSQQNRESPPKRPGTSSGRPSTSHRPEGDPPWIATMYKPDPRLPPDQQILPTHARRLAQEQWEKEGKIGTVYDRDFRLLNTEELPGPELHMDEPKGEKIKSTVLNSPWPLHTPPLGSPRSQGSLTRPGTSGTDHGGYKMMPTILQPQTNGTPLASPKLQNPPRPAIRVQDPPEEKKEKKGCLGCCVM
jgi:hypothetical protein